MTQTISRTYDSLGHARAVITELKAIGVEQDDMSVVAPDDRLDMDGVNTTTTDDGDAVTNGAGIGGVIGGAAGMLAGLGLMAIPGVGPLVAAGWLASTAAGVATGAVAGAATGGIVDALTDSGVDRRDAETYAEAVRRGSILVSVRAEEAFIPRVTAIMDRHSPADLTMRRTQWESEGWSTYDPNARPFSSEQRLREQQRWS